MGLGSSIYLIIVLLSQGVTDKLIEDDTLDVSHRLISLGESPLLKLAIFLASVSTNSGAYLARLLNAWRYCNTLGVCHSLSSGFELKHDRLSGDDDVKANLRR
jgi:hypothetical protein